MASDRVPGNEMPGANGHQRSNLWFIPKPARGARDLIRKQNGVRTPVRRVGNRNGGH